MSNSAKHDDLPPEVRRALKARQSEFKRLHALDPARPMSYGYATHTLYSDYIYGTTSDDHDACRDALHEWLDKWQADESNKWFFRLSSIENHICTPLEAFRTSLDYYIELSAMALRRLLAELIEIGARIEDGVVDDGIAWAKTHAEEMIRDNWHNIAGWAHAARDHGLIDLAASVADEYEHRLQDYITRDAGDAYVAVAMRGKRAAKTIDAKMIEVSRSKGPSQDTDAKAKRRRDCMKRLMEDPEHSSFTRGEAALMLNQSVRTVYNRLEDGTLLLNGADRIPGKSILPLLKEQRKKHSIPAPKK